jgi:hypothetical protein
MSALGLTLPGPSTPATPGSSGGDVVHDAAPAFDGLVESLSRLCDRALGPAVTAASLTGGLGRERQELVVRCWRGAGFRSVRFAILRGDAGTFALNACAFPEPDAALPLFSYEHLVLRHRLHLLALDLLDTSPDDGRWSREELARARPKLARPMPGGAEASPLVLPDWTRGALSPDALFLRAPEPLPAVEQVKSVVLTMFAGLLSCPRARVGAAADGRSGVQNAFHDAMLAHDPAVAYLRRAFGEPIEALAPGVLFPRLG